MSAGVLTPAQRARLTDHLRQGRTPAPSAPPGGSLLVDLSPAGSGRPLFLMHGVAGTVHGFLPLAGELAGFAPVLGMAAPGAGACSPPAGVAEAAARYLETVRDVQPEGPYRIGGWSTGGLVAFEMAKLLEASGERVEMLVLLDAPFLCPREEDSSPARLAAEFVGDAARSAGLSLHDLPTGGGVPAGAQLDWLCEALGRRGGAREGLREELANRFSVFCEQRELIVNHRVRGFVEADTLLLWARRSPNMRHLPGWPSVLAGRIRTRCLDTDHYGVLRPPHARDVASFVEHAFAAMPPASVTAMTLASFS